MNMLNKIYLAIKAWIILQLTNLKNWWLSLFSKDEPGGTNPAEPIITQPGEDVVDEEEEYLGLQSIEDYLPENEQQQFATIPEVSPPIEQIPSPLPQPEGNGIMVPPPPGDGRVTVPPPPGDGRVTVPPPPGSGRVTVPPPPGSNVAFSAASQANIASAPWNGTAPATTGYRPENAYAFESGVPAVPLPPKPVSAFYDGKYDYLFSTIKTETTFPSSVVNEEIWEVLKERLPENYSIPVPTSRMLYKRNY